MRGELERRPLLIAAVGLIVGLTLVRHPIHLLFLVPLPWLLRGVRAIALVAAGTLCGALLAPGLPQPFLTESHFIESDWVIASLPKVTPFGQTCQIEGRSVGLRMTYAGPLSLTPGSVVHITGLAEPPRVEMDALFRSRGLVGRVAVGPESLRLVRRGPWIQELGRSWRDQFMALAARSLPPQAAATASALCFNADGQLDATTRDEMQNTGTTHIIAASGLQVMIVAQAMFWLLALLPAPRWLQIAVVCALLALYAVATGLNPPILRAVLMSTLANVAYLVRREPDWPSALAGSSIVTLLWKPATVYEMGFQLSVVVVLFLSMFAPRVPWRPGVEAWLSRWAIRAVGTSVIAFIAASPLIAYHFGILSLVSVPANLVVAVLVCPAVVLCMIALPVAMIAPSAGTLLMGASLPLLDFIAGLLHALGGKSAAIQMPPFNAYWLLIYYGLLFMLWRPRVRPA